MILLCLKIKVLAIVIQPKVRLPRWQLELFIQKCPCISFFPPCLVNDVCQIVSDMNKNIYSLKIVEILVAFGSSVNVSKIKF